MYFKGQMSINALTNCLRINILYTPPKFSLTSKHSTKPNLFYSKSSVLLQSDLFAKIPNLQIEIIQV